MTVSNTGTILYINIWLADLIIGALDFLYIYSNVSFFIRVSSSCLDKIIYVFVTSRANVVSFTVFYNVSHNVVVFNLSWDRINSNFYSFEYFNGYIRVDRIFHCASLYHGVTCWNTTSIFWMTTAHFIIFTILTLINLPITIPSPIIVNHIVQFDRADSFVTIGAFGPFSIINFLIFSIQRHPDNVTWLEVNRLVVVQSGGSFLNDVAVFVGYKQLAIELEFIRPVCFVARASAVGNGESVSAHAKYHSRSQCYGKYFFHSLSSS